MMDVAFVVAVLGIVVVGMVVHPVHLLHFTRLSGGAQPSRCLVGSLTRPWREFIDAFPCGCQHRTSFPFRL